VQWQGYPVKTSTRLSSEERREAIVKAVRQVFAEKGFHGTTTRELAAAAGVSEALLFKHFPSKEALYLAMHQDCGSEQNSSEIRRVMALEPSTSTLVLMTHFLIAKLVLGPTHSASGGECIMNRLLMRSLMEDGEFARLFLQRLAANWIPKFEESIEAATAAGDLVDCAVLPRLRGWFVHHLAVVIMSYLVPPTPVVDYGVPREKLVEQATRFALRGMGMKDEAIGRCYNPKALALFSS
jgi:AcrR family transcriptional regulator